MKHSRLAWLPLLAVLGGCASIVRGGAQDIAINSTVPDARFEIRNNRTNALQLAGATPATVKLDRGAGYFKSASYTITVSKDGYQPQQFPITASLSGWYAGGNLVVGGLVGYLVVDPATGAMWTLSPEVITSDLVAMTPPPVVAVVPDPAPALQPPLAEQPAGVPEPPIDAPAAAPALVAGGHARLLAPARTRAIPEGDPVGGLEAGGTVTLKVALRNSTGEWWYVQGTDRSGWVRSTELAPQAPATSSGV